MRQSDYLLIVGVLAASTMVLWLLADVIGSTSPQEWEAEVLGSD